MRIATHWMLVGAGATGVALAVCLASALTRPTETPAKRRRSDKTATARVDAGGTSRSSHGLARIAHPSAEKRDHLGSGIRENSGANPRPRPDFSRSQLPTGGQLGQANRGTVATRNDEHPMPAATNSERANPVFEQPAPRVARQIESAKQPPPADPGISSATLIDVLDRFDRVARRRETSTRQLALRQRPSDESLAEQNDDNAADTPAEDDLPAPGDTGDEAIGTDNSGPDDAGADTSDRARSPRRRGPPQSSIKHLDGQATGADHLEINIQDEDLRRVLTQFSEQSGMNILAGPNVHGTVSCSLHDVTLDEALGAILKSTGYVSKRRGDFVYVGDPQDFQMIERNAEQIAVRIYRPNYVSAKDLEVLIMPLLTPAPIGRISVSAPPEVGIPANQTAAGGYSMTETEVVVVQDYRHVLSEVDQVVKEIDKRPPQVSIEAMILSVQLDDQTKFGINFQALRNEQHLRLGVGNPRQAPLEGGGKTDATTGAPLGAFDFASGGMNFAFLDGSLGAFLNFLETIGDTNVIATPRIMCLNKQRAEIQIGQQLGYVTTTLTSTATAQTINFLDTGAQLRLRPFISADGLIRMEVHPELSTGSVQQSGNYTLPNKEVTQVTTNVMVRDGCTVVIGGLMREDLSTSTSQVPLMGSLPVVGPFFRNKTEEIKRNEILVLITPRIVYEPQTCEEGECGAKDFISRQSAAIEHMSPIGKRYMGRKALRKAQAALAAGDRKGALRWADKAIYVDPENLMAVQFRDRINAGAGPVAGPPHGGPSAGPGMAGQPLDGEELPPWLLDGLEGAPAAPAEPLHPRDPGQTGRMIDIERRGVFDDAQNDARR